MKHFEVNGVAELYKEVLGIMKFQPVVSPRGRDTHEIFAFSAVINSKNNAFKADNIPFNLEDALKVAICMATNQKDIKRIRESVTNKHVVPGEYGGRISHQIERIIEQLRNDQVSRQAVIPVIKQRDYEPDSTYLPCTVSISFMVRNGKVHCIVHQRSCDFLKEGQYDLFNYCFLLMLVANSLQLEYGDLYWNVNSLHVYKEDMDMISGKIEENPVHIPYTLNFVKDVVI